MDRGLRALVSGFVAFVLTTAAITLFDDQRDRIDPMTIGGLTGGAVALSVWFSAGHSPAQTEGAGA